MNIEDLKCGEYYHVIGHIGYKNENEVSVSFYNKFGVETSIKFERKYACRLISKIPEQPKHDPCRKFKKGDIAKARLINGRENPYLDYNSKYRILEDEENDLSVPVEYTNSRGMEVATTAGTIWLELVTPVEELEPYSVEEDSHYWHVLYEQNGGKMTVCKFLKSYHPTAKAAAEAECARLNAEYRKENA